MPSEAPTNARQLEIIATLRESSPLHLQLFAGVYGVALTLGFWLRYSATGIEVWWPATGLLVIYLAITSKQRWLTINLIALTLNVAIYSLFAPHWQWQILIFSIIACFEGSLGALAIKHMVPERWYARHSLEIICYVITAALIVSSIGSILTAATDPFAANMTPAQALAVVTEDWLQCVLGICITAPLAGSFVLRTSLPGRFSRLSALQSAFSYTVAAILLALLVAYPGPLFALSDWNRMSIGCILVVALLTYAAAREDPLQIATGSFLTMLLISITCAYPAAPLTALIIEEPELLQGLLTFLLVAPIGAFLVSTTRYEYKHMSGLLEWRQGGENLLARVATKLAAKNGDELTEAIPPCLGQIGQLLTGDACMILSYCAENKELKFSHSWAADASVRSSLQNRNDTLKMRANTRTQFNTGASVYKRRDQLEAGNDYHEFLDFLDARAVAIAPMRESNQVDALLVLAWTNSNARWSELQATHLQAAAQILSTSLIRQHSLESANLYQNQLRKLAARLTRLDDKIRRETALDLHDGAAQSLAVARFKISQLKLSDEVHANTVDTLNELIDDALRQIRDIIDRMCPPILYELGLEMALKQFVREANRRTEIPIDFRVLDELPSLPEEQMALLYRSGRELVTNAVKHANCTHINLSLLRHDNCLLLEVSDDGVGIESSKGKQDGGGLGLFSLREMLSQLDGSIEVESSSKGTYVTVTLPYPEEDWPEQVQMHDQSAENDIANVNDDRFLEDEPTAVASDAKT